ncbi:MAG: SusC/RagA family TonB-linked outer membrane protein [Odoribacteraceae bacterium]|jgi:TonB-linked SusC/RagA family outer membrane protein|nr:SusC/RagA family TonB-linked outer membrane protein [Odoribacteraceae bacterium]
MKENHDTPRSRGPRSGATRVILAVALLLTGIITPCFSIGQGEVKITLRVENAALETVLRTIEERSGYRLLYNLDAVQGITGITLSVDNQPVSRLLDRCLEGTGLGYTFRENTLVISKNELPGTARQQPVPRVSGTVTDKKGETLIGVSVLAESAAVGAATDVNGRFSFVAPDSTGALIVSYIGYKTRRVPYVAGHPLTIVLEEEVSQLDGVTIVAYGTRKTRELVGSVSSVKADDIKEIPTAGFENLLQGRMAGVEIVNQSGAPGGGGTMVVIRGYNTFKSSRGGDPQPDGAPLYVIDGVPMHSFTSTETGMNTIADIDPAIIESVEVLKDAASASIYGSRSGNGVILITTKKGKRGAPAFSATLSYSRSVLPEAPARFGGRMEREYYLEALKHYRTASWIDGSYPGSYGESNSFFSGAYDFFWNYGMPAMNTTTRVLQDSLNPFYNNATDWFRAVFRPGKILNANVQASGGSETLRYMLSGNYYKEAGIMLGSDFNRVGVNLGLYLTPNERVSVNARVYAAFTDRSRGNGSGGSSSNTNYKVEGLTVDPRGTSSLLLNAGPTIEKLLEQLNSQVEDNTGYRFTANGGLEYEFIKGLRAKANGGIDFVQVNRHFFRPSTLDPYTNREPENRIESSIQRVIFAQGEGLLTYKRSWDDAHHLDLLAGISFDRSLELFNKANAEGTPSDYIRQIIGVDPIRSLYDGQYHESRFEVNTNKTVKVNESFFGRVAYNYLQKYLVEATLRRDGSSVFGEDRRWATFPSIAAGWAFSEESFVEIPWLNFGKARASWGRSGVQFAEPYLAHGIMDIGGNYNGIKGITTTEIQNKELGWEESDQYNAGVDAELFGYRFHVKADYYYRYTRGKLWRVPLPSGKSYYGPSVNGQYQNAMDVSNQGVEIELGYDLFRDTPVTWKTKLTLSRNWNRFEKSYSGIDVDHYVIGKPLFQIMMYKGNGYYQTQQEVPAYYRADGSKQYLHPMAGIGQTFTAGDARIVDINGDGSIDITDMVNVGSSIAKVYGGWSHELKWKAFDLHMLFSYALGRDMYKTYTYSSLNAYDNGQGGHALYVNTDKATFWTPENPDAAYARLGSLNGGGGLLEGNLEHVSYMKLKTLTLGYTLGTERAARLGIKGARVYLSGENLFTLTNYSGIDPEAVSIESGHDSFETYPLARKWSAGLTLNF